MSDADNPLKQRLRERIEAKAESGDTETDTESTEHEASSYGDDEDEDDDNEMEMDMDVPEEVEEAAQMLAEAADVAPGQVMEMVGPLFEGEDARDDPQEMAGDQPDIEEIREEAKDVAEAAVPDDVVTEEDLDTKLDEVVDALADETREVMQKAETGSTPTPTADTDGTVTKADLFSDMEDDE